jgi:hypothetical protein
MPQIRRRANFISGLRLLDGLGPEGLDGGKAAPAEHTIDPFYHQVMKF